MEHILSIFNPYLLYHHREYNFIPRLFASYLIIYTTAWKAFNVKKIAVVLASDFPNFIISRHRESRKLSMLMCLYETECRTTRAAGTYAIMTILLALGE